MRNGLEDGWETRRYLVEVYVPGHDVGELKHLAARAARAADELERQGRSIRYLRSIFVPEEEMCFHLYSAGSIVDVREASERAGVDPDRVAAAFEAEGSRYAAALRAPRGEERT
ncbi:MAG: DUF4242 domain-containing protein [Actinobacteria bacterium]|nr:DUF4242 domain-containing protein [Actinomycetota bacterium]